MSARVDLIPEGEEVSSSTQYDKYKPMLIILLISCVTVSMISFSLGVLFESRRRDYQSTEEICLAGMCVRRLQYLTADFNYAKYSCESKGLRIPTDKDMVHLDRLLYSREFDGFWSKGIINYPDNKCGLTKMGTTSFSIYPTPCTYRAHVVCYRNITGA